MASGMEAAPAAHQYLREKRDRRPPLCAEGSELLWDTQTGPCKRVLGPGLWVQHIQWSHSCPPWRGNSHCLPGGGVTSQVSPGGTWALLLLLLRGSRALGRVSSPFPSLGVMGSRCKAAFGGLQRERAAVGMCWAASSLFRFPQAAQNLE